jgi:putative transposase
VDQIIGLLRDGEAGGEERRAVPEAWDQRCDVLQLKAKYGGVTVSEAGRLRTLQDENRRLKKLLAESMLDVSALKDLRRKIDSICRALRCGGEADGRPRLLRAPRLQNDRGSIGRHGNMSGFAGEDEAMRERMREIADEGRRFGYHRLAILLRREGEVMNPKKVYRPYREKRLTLRKPGGRMRRPGTRAPWRLRTSPNNAGRRTSCRMLWPAAGGSGCSP